MSIKKQQFILGSISIIVIMIIGFFIFKGNGNEKYYSGIKYKEVAVKLGDFKITVSADGVVKPIDRIEIKSKASGEIVHLPIEEGDFIQQGDLIAQLDQKDEKAAVAQAQANLDIAKAELKQAQQTFNRRNLLFKNNLISEEEKDQIELGLAVAKGKLIQAVTVFDRAKERFSESIVRSPIDGIILQKYVEKGQIIASGVSNVGGGTPIIDIADMSSVYIEAGIDEIDIGKIDIGQMATVFAEAYPQDKFSGKIVRIAPEAKIEQNVTLFDVIVEVENKNGKLKSGMNINIEISIVNKTDVLIAPQIALQDKQNGNQKSKDQIVLLKKGAEFVPQNVEIGLSDFKQVEILAGLTDGDILGIPMTSRIKEANDRRENRIRSSRSFGAGNKK